MDFSKFSFRNPPASFELSDGKLVFATKPETDYWQRTNYGTGADNGHAFLTEAEGDFTFSVKASYGSDALYDQCGPMVYIDTDNWVKSSIEFISPEASKLGSVVTNLGYSDWAFKEIVFLPAMWYRLSRKGQDFLLEYSENGKAYHQMRVFHLHDAKGAVKVGVYACSPMNTSFTAEFSEFSLGERTWDGE